MGTASLLTEILAYFTACTPAGGRHQLHFLPNEQETFSQQNLDRCKHRILRKAPLNKAPRHEGTK
jgi:hypothetical protein